MRCSFCHDSFSTQGGEPCPECGTRLHRECWSFARDCPSLGCEGRPLRRPARSWSAVWALALLLSGFNHLRRPGSADQDLWEIPRTCFCEGGNPDSARGAAFDRPPEPSLWRVVRRSVEAMTHDWNEAATASYLHRHSQPADLTIVEEVRERRRRRS